MHDVPCEFVLIKDAQKQLARSQKPVKLRFFLYLLPLGIAKILITGSQDYG